jgi:hypothetical protein
MGCYGSNLSRKNDKRFLRLMLIFFGGRVWTQDLTLARQVLYHLSHSTSCVILICLSRLYCQCQIKVKKSFNYNWRTVFKFLQIYHKHNKNLIDFYLFNNNQLEVFMGKKFIPKAYVQMQCLRILLTPYDGACTERYP